MLRHLMTLLSSCWGPQAPCTSMQVQEIGNLPGGELGNHQWIEDTFRYVRTGRTLHAVVALLRFPKRVARLSCLLRGEFSPLSWNLFATSMYVSGAVTYFLFYLGVCSCETSCKLSFSSYLRRCRPTDWIVPRTKHAVRCINKLRLCSGECPLNSRFVRCVVKPPYRNKSIHNSATTVSRDFSTQGAEIDNNHYKALFNDCGEVSHKR